MKASATSDEAAASELGALPHRDVLTRLQRTGRGCVVVGLHFRNHRFLAPGLAAMGYPISALIADFPQKPSQFGAGATKAAAHFRSSYARDARAEYVSARATGRSIEAMIGAVQAGRFLLLMADGCLGRQRVGVGFLGQRFLLPCSAPVIASRAGVPLVPILSSRDKREVFIGEPFFPHPDMRAADALREALLALEPLVLERPWEWWTWVHIGRERSEPSEPTWRLLSGAEAFAPF